MIARVTLAFPFAILHVVGPDNDDFPEFEKDQLVISTPSCITVGTLVPDDGETSVTLTDEVTLFNEADPSRSRAGMRRAFRGVLVSSRKEVLVCTAELDTVLKLPIPNVECSVEIWVNHETEPDVIWILVNG